MMAHNLVDDILSEFGRIDILVNHAVVNPLASLLELDEWDWRRTIDVNLSGPFFLTQLIGRVMREQGGGVIVNIMDTSSGHPDNKPVALYASKHGLVGLTYAAAHELGQYHIRVNGVTPLIRQSKDLAQKVEFTKGEQTEESQIDVAETVKMIISLCSQDAQGINGIVYDMYGAICKE